MDADDARRGEGFYGRRRGKAIRPRQKGALEAGLAQYGIDLSKPAPADLKTLFADPVEHVALEIGFGGGEHLLAEAAANPTIGFIGVEPFVNGMAKLTAALAEEPRGNLRIFPDNAVLLLDWLPAASLDRIELLYPDPWPKKKHWKRRFVSRPNLDRLARAVKPGGLFRFASDIDTYVDWTLLACRRHGAFRWTAQTAADWHAPYPGWPGTRYEDKALREGRRPAYLSFVRG